MILDLITTENNRRSRIPRIRTRGADQLAPTSPPYQTTAPAPASKPYPSSSFTSEELTGAGAQPRSLIAGRARAKETRLL